MRESGVTWGKEKRASGFTWGGGGLAFSRGGVYVVQVKAQGRR